MSLRDLVKQDIARQVSRAHLSAKRPDGDERDTEAARERQRRQRAQSKRGRRAADAGGLAGGRESDDAASQAARAQRFAMMTAPVKARLDPVDVPHPYGDDRNDRGVGKPSDQGASLEDFVVGGSDGATDDSLLDFGGGRD